MKKWSRAYLKKAFKDGMVRQLWLHGVWLLEFLQRDAQSGTTLHQLPPSQP